MIRDISNKLLKSISYESQGSMTLMNQRPASFAEHEETHALRTTTVPKDSGVYSFQSTNRCLKIEAYTRPKVLSAYRSGLELKAKVRSA